MEGKAYTTSTSSNTIGVWPRRLVSMRGGKALEQLPSLRVEDTTAVNDKGGEAKIASSTNF